MQNIKSMVSSLQQEVKSNNNPQSSPTSTSLIFEALNILSAMTNSGNSATLTILKEQQDFLKELQTTLQTRNSAQESQQQQILTDSDALLIKPFFRKSSSPSSSSSASASNLTSNDEKEMIMIDPSSPSSSKLKNYAFLSYAGPDRHCSPHFVSTHLMMMLVCGIPIWYDQYSIERSGIPNNSQIIEDALLNAKLVVCYISNAYVQRKWPCLEAASAYANRVPILPVRPYHHISTSSSASSSSSSPASAPQPEWANHPNAFELFDDVDQSSSSTTPKIPSKRIKIGKLLSRIPGLNMSSDQMSNLFASSCSDVLLDVIDKLECRSELDPDVKRLLYDPSLSNARIEFVRMVSRIVNDQVYIGEWRTNTIATIANKLKDLIPEIEINDTFESLFRKHIMNTTFGVKMVQNRNLLNIL